MIGVAIVLVRHRSRLATVGWALASPARFGAASILFLVPALAILGYVIVRYSEDIDATPVRLLLALDHTTFIGILTNAIFGLLFVAAAARRDVVVMGGPTGVLGDQPGRRRLRDRPGRGRRGDQADRHAADGAGILLGLLVVAMRLRATSVEQLPGRSAERFESPVQRRRRDSNPGGAQHPLTA
ncbi:MAG: hypothetical protein U0V56_02690 [Actinomycetota bacterium]